MRGEVGMAAAVALYTKCKKDNSLRSWRYCGRARNKILAAEPPEASGEADNNLQL